MGCCTRPQAWRALTRSPAHVSAMGGGERWLAVRVWGCEKSLPGPSTGSAPAQTLAYVPFWPGLPAPHPFAPTARPLRRSVANTLSARAHTTYLARVLTATRTARSAALLDVWTFLWWSAVHGTRPTDDAALRRKLAVGDDRSCGALNANLSG